jgi:hypothetical protein
MATPAGTEAESKEAAPAASVAQEQDINPWSVEGGVDADGKIVAIDYTKLTQSVFCP